MTQLGLGLDAGGHYAEQLRVHEADLATDTRLGAPEVDLLTTKNNLAMCYGKTGRPKEARRLHSEVHAGWLRLKGTDHEQTINAANNLAISSMALGHLGDAQSLLRKNIRACRRSFGDDHVYTFRARSLFVRILYADPASIEDLREAVSIMEDVCRRGRRVLGDSHPEYHELQRNLATARRVLARAVAPH